MQSPRKSGSFSLTGLRPELGKMQDAPFRELKSEGQEQQQEQQQKRGMQGEKTLPSIAGPKKPSYGAQPSRRPPPTRRQDREPVWQGRTRRGGEHQLRHGCLRPESVHP